MIFNKTRIEFYFRILNSRIVLLYFSFNQHLLTFKLLLNIFIYSSVQIKKIFKTQCPKNNKGLPVFYVCYFVRMYQFGLTCCFRCCLVLSASACKVCILFSNSSTLALFSFITCRTRRYFFKFITTMNILLNSLRIFKQ